jgi:putative transposase
MANILIDEWTFAHDRHGWAVGRYVIMPDHVHFFCRPEREANTLSQFMGAWKRWSSRRAHQAGRPRSATTATVPLWQREFFDHVIRSSESYSEKWNYVFENPVRAGLVAQADDWPHAGEIEALIL